MSNFLFQRSSSYNYFCAKGYKNHTKRAIDVCLLNSDWFYKIKWHLSECNVIHLFGFSKELYLLKLISFNYFLCWGALNSTYLYLFIFFAYLFFSILKLHLCNRNALSYILLHTEFKWRLHIELFRSVYLICLFFIKSNCVYFNTVSFFFLYIWWT